LEATGTGHEFPYQALLPNRSLTASVAYNVRGRGKPLAYNTTDDE
jgi:hypothetical protein